MKNFVRPLLAACFLAAWWMPALAAPEHYPEKPVRLVVPFPPGGTNDIMARYISQKLSVQLGQPFVIENKSGAGGLIGADHVAKAAPDGYTLLVSAAGPMGVALAMYAKVPYDVNRDFTPVAIVAEATMVLVSNPNFKPRNLKELVDYSKTSAVPVRAAINATGSMHHLLTELFALQNNTKFTMVPYRGSGPAIMDMLAGHIDLDIENMPAVADHVKTGKLRAIATLDNERSPLLPDVPTFKELGWPEYVAAPWFALVAPAGTPEVIVNKLNKAINDLLQQPESREWLAKQGAKPVPLSPSQSADKIRLEAARWNEIVRKTGVKSN